MKPECAKEWSRKFLRENFTNTFLTSKYKEHLEDILFDQEKSLLPATQPLVEEKKAKKALKKQIKDLSLLIEDLYTQKEDLERQLQYGITRSPEENKERATFVRQCPANGCRGFLSSQWKCGICEQWSCPECHELKGFTRDSHHTCDPNNIKTAKLLEKDSKPCPKCQSLIFKISGCDQIWCTQCHVAFSWKTGKLEKHIHNPHFYEWQRKNGGGNAPRNHADIECGRELTHYTVSRMLDLAKKYPHLYKVNQHKHTKMYSKKIIEISDIIRNIIHNTTQELPRFQTDYVVRNQDLRIKYLEGLITEYEFKLLIQRNDKKNRKNTEISQVLQLANTTVTDIVYRLIDNLDKARDDPPNIDLFLREIEEIIKYCNDIFKDIAFTYNTVQYKFSNIFMFEREEKEKKEKKKAALAAIEDNINNDLI
jgi:hypothetical protein